MLKKNLPFWAKATLWGVLLFFVAAGWLLLFLPTDTDAEKTTALAANKNNYIRLHILANSDSSQDQEIKLKVKDAVVNYLTPLIKNAATPREAGQIIKERQDDILQIAQNVLAQNAVYYPVTMELGNFDFPLKSYGALVLPAGNYQAVRLWIGEGAGQNWWCVLFPPLCFINSAVAQTAPIVEKNVPAENNPVENNQSEIKIRWKILELLAD